MGVVDGGRAKIEEGTDAESLGEVGGVRARWGI